MMTVTSNPYNIPCNSIKSMSDDQETDTIDVAMTFISTLSNMSLITECVKNRYIDSINIQLYVDQNSIKITRTSQNINSFSGIVRKCKGANINHETPTTPTCNSILLRLSQVIIVLAPKTKVNL